MEENQAQNSENINKEKPSDLPNPKKKRKPRTFLLIAVFIAIIVAGWYGYKTIFPSSGNPRINPLNFVPADAFFIMETDRAYDFWTKLGKTQLWNTLTKDEEWKAHGEQLAYIEETLSGFDQILERLNDRKVYLSGHLYYKGAYDYLYILDMQGLAVLRTYMTSQENTTKREFLGHTIYEQLDLSTKETLYFTFIDNYWVGSYAHSILESSISNYEEASFSRSFNFIEVRKKALGEGVVRLYFNYDHLFPYLKTITDPGYIELLKENLPLYHTGSYFDVEESSLMLEGYSNYNDSLRTYLPIFEKAGVGGLEIAEVLPSNTALYFSIGFSSFLTFYEALDEQLREDPLYGEEYGLYTKKTEKFLNIDLKEDFAAWLDDEFAVVQLEVTGDDPELALIFKAKKKNEALEKMDFLSRQVRRRTPVKFKQIDYRGYPINFMSVKGMFNLVLGKMFNYFDRPYYTIIDEYVIFSNQPQTLRRFIDEWLAGNTLSKVSSFQSFKKQIGEKHSVFCYLQLPLLEKSGGGMIDRETIELLKSKRSIVEDFPQFAMKLQPSNGIYLTKVLVSIENIERPVKNEDKEIVVADSVNYDSLWSIDPGEQIAIDSLEIELDDLGAKEQSEMLDDGTQYEVRIKDGLKHGNYFEYYPTGELKVKGKYKDDLKDGVWKYYDEGGDLIKKERYRDGVFTMIEKL